MGWTIKYAPHFKRDVKKLDRLIQKKLRKFFAELAELENPRSRGKALTQNLSGLWRYRIGSYRVMCEIRDSELIVLALRVGHRSRIYD